MLLHTTSPIISHSYLQVFYFSFNVYYTAPALNALCLARLTRPPSSPAALLHPSLRLWLASRARLHLHLPPPPRPRRRWRRKKSLSCLSIGMRQRHQRKILLLITPMAGWQVWCSLPPLTWNFQRSTKPSLSILNLTLCVGLDFLQENSLFPS
jgi:hypothetical protein